MTNTTITAVVNAFETAGEDVLAGVVAGAALIIGQIPAQELGAFTDAVKAFETALTAGNTWGSAFSSALTVLYNDEKFIVSQTTIQLLNAFTSSATAAGAVSPTAA